jgi:hypothetical protein
VHLTFDSNLNDVSGNGNNGSYAGSGASISSVNKFGGGALDAGGSGYVTFPDQSFATTDDWSISFWYNASSTAKAPLAGDSARNHSLVYNNSGSPDRSYLLRGSASGNSATWTTAQAPTALDTGVWHHIAISCTGSGNNLKFYEDGVEISGWNSGDDTALIFSRVAGGHGDFGSLFDGLIDELWIMDYALDNSQVQTLYNNNDAGASPATNLTEWAAAHGLTGGDELPYADGDVDDVFNIVEYAFNLIPGVKDAYKLEAGGTSGLPRGELKPGSNDRLQFEYVRRKNVSDISYGVQFSDNLFSNWTDSTMPETITSINDDWERVTVEDSVLVPDATNRFGRAIIIE